MTLALSIFNLREKDLKYICRNKLDLLLSLSLDGPRVQLQAVTAFADDNDDNDANAGQVPF